MASQKFSCLVVFLAFSGLQAEVEHPVVKPIEGFVLLPSAQQKVSDFDEYRFRRKDENGRDEFFIKKGKFWDLNYHKPAAGGSDDNSFSKTEIIGNFTEAVKEAGGKILRQYEGDLHFSLTRLTGDSPTSTFTRVMVATGFASLTRNRSSGISNSLPLRICTPASTRRDLSLYMASTSIQIGPASKSVRPRPSRKWSSCSRRMLS